MRRAFLIAAATVVALAAFCGPVAAAPPPVVASAYVVRGPDGAVLASRAANVERPLASITKLMTVMVALEHARLDEVVTVSPAAASVGEASVALRPGERLTVHDLAVAALVPSANDAATALAAYVGQGSIPRFVELMNEKARALGLTSTHFANPHGLDQAGHYSSARDVTTLLTAALRNPFIRAWSTRSSATIAGGRQLTSTDDLLGALPLVGAKTGHTDGAGWSQVAAAEAGGTRVTVSVLGAPSEEQRNRDLDALVTWGLAQYHRVEAVSRRVYGHAETGSGRAPVAIVAPRSLVRTVRVGRPLVERVVLSPTLALPVARGQRVGEVRVFDGKKLIARSPLVTAAAVTSVGTAGKVGWYARRTVHHLVGLVS
jgi:D-alanyl-D-alanine carboxypeptidase (penicillin-binding protein 5/6)